MLSAYREARKISPDKNPNDFNNDSKSFYFCIKDNPKLLPEENVEDPVSSTRMVRNFLKDNFDSATVEDLFCEASETKQKQRAKSFGYLKNGLRMLALLNMAYHQTELLSLPAIEILLQGSHTDLETEFKDTILSSDYYALQLKANKSELAEDIQKVVQHQKLDSILHK